jgi:hypothetical protein
MNIPILSSITAHSSSEPNRDQSKDVVALEMVLALFHHIAFKVGRIHPTGI